MIVEVVRTSLWQSWEKNVLFGLSIE